MLDISDAIEQGISNNEKSICEKCSHKRVCRAIDNQPCFECNQFEQEVVRCKDCEYRHDSCFAGKGNTYCDYHHKYFGLDDFCSYGERRSDG